MASRDISVSERTTDGQPEGRPKTMPLPCIVEGGIIEVLMGLYFILKNVKVANALQLETADIAPVVLGCFGQICTSYEHKLLFLVSVKNSDITIKFSDPDVVKKNNNSAIRQHFLAVTLTFDLITLNVKVVPNLRESNNPRLSYSDVKVEPLAAVSIVDLNGS